MSPVGQRDGWPDFDLSALAAAEWAAEERAEPDPGGASGGRGPAAEQGPQAAAHRPAAVTHQILQVGHLHRMWCLLHAYAQRALQWRIQDFL